MNPRIQRLHDDSFLQFQPVDDLASLSPQRDAEIGNPRPCRGAGRRTHPLRGNSTCDDTKIHPSGIRSAKTFPAFSNPSQHSTFKTVLERRYQERSGGSDALVPGHPDQPITLRTVPVTPGHTTALTVGDTEPVSYHVAHSLIVASQPGQRIRPVHFAVDVVRNAR